MWWHDTYGMPDPKPDSTVHSVSVAVVISERQGEHHFHRYRYVGLTMHGDEIGEFLDEYF